jgi:hypothetical protein
MPLGTIHGLPLERETAFQCVSQLQVEGRGAGRLLQCCAFPGLFRAQLRCAGPHLHFVQRVWQQAGQRVLRVL